MPKFNLGWLKDKNGEKFAPKTFIKQVISKTGENLEEILDNTKEKLEQKIDSPSIAKVGQLLEVEDVDANGKPIKWKAVDAPNNQIQADWNQNDSSQLDYVKNRPFYSELTNKLKLLSLSNYKFKYQGLYYHHFIEYDYSETLSKDDWYIKSNKEYEVNWKGATYRLPSKTYIDKDGNEYIYIGNIKYAYNIIHPQPSEDTGELFLFMSNKNSKLTIVCQGSEVVDGNVSLSLYEYSDYNEYENVGRLDEKYIPNNIPKIESATEGQLLVVLGVDENGKPNSFGVVNNDFAKISDYVQSDWSQLDDTQMDYIKNKTHYAKVLELDIEQEIVCGSRTSSFSKFTTIDERWHNLLVNDIVEGVTINGEPIGFYSGDSSRSNFRIGDSTLMLVISKSSPSAMIQDFEMGAADLTGTMTAICKYSGVDELKQLDEIYIPDNIPKVSSASVGQILEVEKVDADGKPIKWKTVDLSTNDISHGDKNTSLSDVIDMTKESISNHEKRYSSTYFILTDTVNEYEYIVQMQNGSLVSFCKTAEIRVDKLPDKTSGVFDPAGLVITAIKQDGTLQEITNYTLSAKNKVVTVTYSEYGQVYTTTFETDMFTIDEILMDFEYTTNDDGTYTLTAWRETLNGVPSTEMVIPDIGNNLIIVEVV